MKSRNPKLREATRGRVFELAAITATAAGKFVIGDLLNLGLYYVVVVSVFWIGYVLLRHRWEPALLARWGFNRHGIGAGVRMIAPFALVTLGGFIIFGLATGRAETNWKTVVLLVTYPIWGLIQQFMLVALLADNVAALSREHVPEWAAVLLAGFLFALVHMPVLPLVVAAFFLGLVTTTVFFRTRSIWVPGFFHGWFATIFYVFVLGEDPLGSLLSVAFGL